MAQIPKEEDIKSTAPVVKGGAFEGVQESPFAPGQGEGVDKGREEPEWIVSKERYKWDENFHSLNPVDGKITGKLYSSSVLSIGSPAFPFRRGSQVAHGQIQITQFGAG